MIEEILFPLLKAIACILRFIFEAGIDLGIKEPGKLILKVLWPPYWTKKVTYEGPLINLFGLLFYLGIFYLVVNICCN